MVAVALSIVLLFAGTVSSFIPLGPIWQDPSGIRLFITKDHNDPRVDDWFGYYESATVSAMNSWNSGTFAWIYFVRRYSNPHTGVRVTVVFNENANWDGLATFTAYTSGGTLYFRKVEVRLNAARVHVHHPISLAGHELGHALGLDDVSLHRLMNGCTLYRNTHNIVSPLSGDISGVNTLHSSLIENNNE